MNEANPVDAGAVIDAIQRGVFDGKEDRLYAAIKSRQSAVAEQTLARLDVGDKVQLKNIRPKYFAGAHGIVKSIEKDTISLRICDDTPVFDSHGRQRTAARVASVCVELVEKAPVEA